MLQQHFPCLGQRLTGMHERKVVSHKTKEHVVKQHIQRDGLNFRPMRGASKLKRKNRVMVERAEIKSQVIFGWRNESLDLIEGSC